MTEDARIELRSVRALVAEIDSAYEQDRPLLWIRVTTDALEGSPAALPITPERGRIERLRVFPGDVVDADPETYLRALEIMVHPKDWFDVIDEAVGQMDVMYFRWRMEARSAARYEFMGIPVIW